MQNVANEFCMTDITLKVLETDSKGCVWLVLFVIEKSLTENFGIPYIEMFLSKEIRQFTLNQLLLKTLTNMEKEVAFLLFGNNTQKEIADLMIKSVNTIKTHINSVYDKLGVENKFDFQKRLLLR